MIRHSRTRIVLLTTLLSVATACGESAPEPGSGDAVASTTTVTADGQTRIDMDAIFPAGPGRDLLLNNCQSCHTWAPVVVLQMSEDEWYRWSLEHRGRVPNLTEEEFQTLYAYLVENFNPSRPVPELPPALLEGWTTY